MVSVTVTSVEINHERGLPCSDKRIALLCYECGRKEEAEISLLLQDKRSIMEYYNRISLYISKNLLLY